MSDRGRAGFRLGHEEWSEHNDYVFSALLGMDAAELAALQEARKVAEWPALPT
jgi:hypothetical protein